MQRIATCLLAVAFFALASRAYALYDVADEGLWPKTWPAELEPLRKQSRTLVGPLAPFMNQHYAIRFTTREEFEAAWPHLLKVKTPGAPVFLSRGPNFFLDKGDKAGVVVYSPPSDQPAAVAAAPIPVTDVGQTRINTTYIELVVDGEIVDLNRIPLPADCPIIDQRFKDMPPTPARNSP